MDVCFANAGAEQACVTSGEIIISLWSGGVRDVHPSRSPSRENRLHNSVGSAAVGQRRKETCIEDILPAAVTHHS